MALGEWIEPGIDFDRFETPNHELECLEDIVPELEQGGESAQMYRVHTWEEFKTAEAYPLRPREQARVDRCNGKASEAVYEEAEVRTRYLRARLRVAHRHGVSENWVSQAGTDMYQDAGEYADRTTRFAFDLKKTEDALRAAEEEDR
ncbi:hypothetical protein [Salinigranum halophilum]|uniref:hypothetical protein n=1 Tax=Salinigranum halophilum TaxID=2565931 RepID=UPI0010A947B7|nr:hypothetical protein [Salinigranum halophilum]